MLGLLLLVEAMERRDEGGEARAAAAKAATWLP
jgi:hypothetical protein